MVLHAVTDAVTDSLKLFPFLLFTYLLMEFIETRTSDHTKQMLRESGRYGPILGGMLGVVPQCGFSAAASNLYAGRVITIGTLLSVYLSTSDEMLPIFISESVPVPAILKILFLKLLIGACAGILVDFVYRKRNIWFEIKKKGDKRKNNPFHIQEMCEQEHCHCGAGGIWKSALTHTIQVWIFIFLVSLALDLTIGAIGTAGMKHLILQVPVLGELLAGLIGLIPNCAASVVLTELYLEGAMNFGALMSGLLVSAGVGLLVLFRVNKEPVHNLKIAGLLYLISCAAGILIEILNLGKWIHI